MPPVTPSRIRAMRKVCLRAGQEGACGFEVALVHEHSRWACHRDAACKRTTVSGASAISSKLTARPERKPKAYVEANRERGGRRPHREHRTEPPPRIPK